MVNIKNITLKQGRLETSRLRHQPNSFTLVIRDDTQHVTRPLKGLITNHINNNQLSKCARFNRQAKAGGPSMEEHVSDVVENAYRSWMHKSLKSLGRYLDLDKSGLTSGADNDFYVHLYEPEALVGEILHKTEKPDDGLGLDNPYYISLDDMITVPEGRGGDISFSRLFSLCGKDYFDYVARPGHPSIADQMMRVRADLQTRFEQTGEMASIVLLEDNIRHARMLNWLENKMDEAGLFEYATLAGISTCFCSASPSELQDITHKGESVPVAIGVNYRGVNSDVQTPRDLMFDGFVVKINGEKGRLPGIFMDVASRFSVQEKFADEFKSDIRRINRSFCFEIKKALGVDVPLSWFISSEPVAHVTKMSPQTPMINIMK
tara:strand:- start:227233 stop:228363 length:1131 start_codon:yes stop_codon:yes gene_type:complete